MAQLEANNVPAGHEIAAMAAVLMRRYGMNADGVARHFQTEHEAVGDETRAALWRRVRGCLAARGGKPTFS